MSLLGRAKWENMRLPDRCSLEKLIQADKLASLAIHAEDVSLAEAGRSRSNSLFASWHHRNPLWD